MNKIDEAHKIIRDEFENNPDFKMSYISKIEELLQDNWVTGYDKKNVIAEGVLRLMFYS